MKDIEDLQELHKFVKHHLELSKLGFKGSKENTETKYFYGGEISAYSSINFLLNKMLK